MRIEDIKAKMKEVRATTQDLADHMGVDHHVADRIVNARRKHLTTTEAEAIRRFFQLREKPVYEPPAPVRDASGTGEVGRASIPLFGGADTNDGWKISLAQDATLMRIMPHPGQLTAKRPFAVEVADNTMAPRFQQSEIAYVAGGLNPKPGQDCLVEYADLTARIFQLVERAEKRIVLRQLNPLKQVIINASENVKLHAIVGRN